MSRKIQGILCICALIVFFAAPVAFADDSTEAPSVVEVILGVIGELFGGETTSNDSEFLGSIVPGG